MPGAFTRVPSWRQVSYRSDMKTQLTRSCLALTSLTALAFVSAACSSGQTGDAGDASDVEAGRIDATVDAVIDTGVDVPAAPDVFTCTGSTCTIANGTGACVGGVCQVMTCVPGGFDMDHDARNGCECIVGVVPSTCAMPLDLGTLDVGSFHAIQSLMTSPTGEHWARVTFAPGGREHIEFAANPGMAFHVEVLSSCTAASHLACPDRMEGSTAITAWEFFDTVPDAGMPNDNLPMRMTAVPTTVFIHITTSRATTTCDPYTLIVGNDHW